MPIDIKTLACPTCTNELHLKDGLYCNICHTYYPISNEKYYFTKVNLTIPDKFDHIKNYLKQFARLYNFLITVISPVYIPAQLKRFLKKESDSQPKVMINLGSGNSRISKNIINIDIFDYPNVDLVCDISNLPLKKESVDLIISIAVLEHVSNPGIIAREISRVLKPGGKIFIYIPFIQGYHASPYDYQRYTISGIEYLFKDFRIIEVRCGSGPTSGFLWILQEWLAIAFSFGFTPLYRLLHLLIMGVTFPLKFLDALLIHHPFAKNIASGFSLIAKKV